MENFVDQTITRAEKHKNEVVTNLGIDDIRNVFDSQNKRSCSTKNIYYSRIFERKKFYSRIIWKFCLCCCDHTSRKLFRNTFCYSKIMLAQCDWPSWSWLNSVIPGYIWLQFVWFVSINLDGNRTANNREGYFLNLKNLDFERFQRSHN